MVDVTNQRRMAAAILKVGLNRVYMPPDKEKLQEISEATTRAMVRSLIVRRYIRKRPIKGVSRGRARAFHAQRVKGRRRGHGSRRGKAGARQNSKVTWTSNIREMRRTLRSLRHSNKITSAKYRAYYRAAKGGQFHNKGHLLLQMEARGDLKAMPGRKPMDVKPPSAPAKPLPLKKAKDAEPKRSAKPPKDEPKRGLLGRTKSKKEE